MSSNEENLLEQIVAQLQPEYITDNVTVRQRDVKTSYHIERIKVDNHQQFMDELVRYIQHHWKKIHNGEISESEAFGKAKEILEGRLNEHGGYNYAYQLAKQGRMDDIIGVLASHFESKARNDHIQRVMYSVDPDDMVTKTKIVKQVFEIYKKLTPDVKNFRDPVFFAAQYDTIVREYVQLVESIVSKYVEPQSHIVTPDNHTATPEQRSGSRLYLPTPGEIAEINRGRDPTTHGRHRN
jgi:hypothetical protein